MSIYRNLLFTLTSKKLNIYANANANANAIGLTVMMIFTVKLARVMNVNCIITVVKL